MSERKVYKIDMTTGTLTNIDMTASAQTDLIGKMQPTKICLQLLEKVKDCPTQDQFIEFVSLGLDNPADFEIFEYILDKLPVMPQNWISRCSQLDNTYGLHGILPPECAGTASPIKVAKLITEWEISDNLDGTTQYLIRRKDFMPGRGYLSTSCITNLKISIPFIDGIDYDDTKLSYDNGIHNVVVYFTPNKEKNVFEALLGGVVWVHNDDIANFSHELIVSLTTSKDKWKQFVMSPMIIEYNNIHLAPKCDTVLSSMFEGFVIMKKDNILTWGSQKFALKN